MILKSLCRKNRFVLLYFTKLSCRINLVLYSWSRNSISGSTFIIWSRAASNMIFFLLQASGVFRRRIYIKSESLEIVKSLKSECIGSHEVCQVRYISPNQKAIKLMISKLLALLQYVFGKLLVYLIIDATIFFNFSPLLRSTRFANAHNSLGPTLGRRYTTWANLKFTC